MAVDAVVDFDHQNPPSKPDLMEGHRLLSTRAPLPDLLVILGPQYLWRRLRPIQTSSMAVVNNMWEVQMQAKVPKHLIKDLSHKLRKSI